MKSILFFFISAAISDQPKLRPVCHSPEFSWGSPLMAVRFLGLPAFSFTLKVLDGSHERAMLAWANSWISDRLDRMSKQGDSPNYECGGSCGSAKGA